MSEMRIVEVLIVLFLLRTRKSCYKFRTPSVPTISRHVDTAVASCRSFVVFRESTRWPIDIHALSMHYLISARCLTPATDRAQLSYFGPTCHIRSVGVHDGSTHCSLVDAFRPVQLAANSLDHVTSATSGLYPAHIVTKNKHRFHRYYSGKSSFKK